MILYIIANWKWLLGAAASAALGIAMAVTTIDRNQWRAAARKGDATIAKFIAAQKQAEIDFRAAITAKEREYKDHADDADQTHTAELVDARSAADRYIATHRVPACHSGGAPSSTTTGTQGGSSGIPASVPADAVVVTSGDVQACTAAAKYALDAHNWAVGL